MTRLTGTRRILRRHRLLFGLAGVLLVLGVAALNTHASLPDDHEAGGICLCALSLAILGGVGLAVRGPMLRPRVLLRLAPMRAPARSWTDECPPGNARAGPFPSLVLRR